MKIAVIYNRESNKVINFFGIPNLEKYGKENIKRITTALKKAGHQVKTFEGDKYLINNLEEFMPRVIKGETPGIAFNISYGIQGKARYTHVPGILEMIGIPYIGSNPVAHSIALDKVVTKMILMQHKLPTPDFFVLESPDFTDIPEEIKFPLIVKPKSEAVSFGIKIVNDIDQLKEASRIIFEQFAQPVLVEQYIEGKEINVGLLGNDTPQAFEPVEIVFGDGGPNIFTFEDKKHLSGREVFQRCPAEIPKETKEEAELLAIKAFKVIGCYDFARVDMRIDSNGKLYILEINSLASLGVSSSYVIGADKVGIDFDNLVNKIIEAASTRYFGTPKLAIENIINSGNKKDTAFNFLVQRRDKLETRLQEWCKLTSRTYDTVGLRLAGHKISAIMKELKMKEIEEYTDHNFTYCWSTNKGFEGGTLLICHLDIPFDSGISLELFKKTPENLYGEGIGISRAALVMIEFAIRTLKTHKLLNEIPLGILLYTDEGTDAYYSRKIIQKASSKAKQVLILRPGNPDEKIITDHRGLIKYRLIVEGKPGRPNQYTKSGNALLWLSTKLSEIAKLNSGKKRINISANNVNVESFPMLIPHKVTANLLISYYDNEKLDETYDTIKEILNTPKKYKWELNEISNRPPMKEKSINKKLVNTIKEVAKNWDIPLETTTSSLPSVGGLIQNNVPVISGIGPVAENIYTSQEFIHRISLIQRTLLLTQFLIHELEQ